MIQLLMILSLTPVAQPELAQFKPCVWPNTCATEQVQTAANDFEICVAPKTCAPKAAPAPAVAQFKPCVWPNTCGANQEQAPVVARI